MRLSAAILAAGQGTRMKSRLPKVLHPICGEPMILHVVDRARELGADPIVVIVGHGAEEVRAAVGQGVEYAEQAQQLGTAHAMAMARPALAGRSDAILVLYGDVPLMRAETLRDLIQTHRESGAVLSVLTAVVEDPTAYGRIVRNEGGEIVGIVEEVAATPQEREIREINTGIYCLQDGWVWPRLDRIRPDSRKAEYYLPELVAIAVGEGRPVASARAQDPDELMGINNRVQLAEAEAHLRRRVRERLMLSGVTILDPPSTYIDERAAVGQDTTIHPNTHILGATSVGEGCQIGPNALIEGSTVGDRCRVVASIVRDSHLDEDCSVGPFAHLRAGARLERGARVGSFAEVKAARLGPGAQMAHFGFLGDAEVGEGANLGAGAVTCNFDGSEKHRARIGREAFVGSGAMLVAPVEIGEGAVVGAGSVVTEDVPPHSVAMGAPARVRDKGGQEAESCDG